ncbi:MAG: hypothetical protein IT172_04290 [Acidobacteria bacterium]|nr:hypothetical protein [Acidobacteriota bacterium]
MTSVAIQGIRGSYSDAAALELFGSGAELIECRTFGGVFDALTDGVAEYAVLPVRNSIIGEIGTVAGLLLTHTTERSDEIDIQIEHVLAAAELIDVSSLKIVRSHWAALDQCSRFFEANPHLTPVASPDTATSIRAIVEEGSQLQAAIGSERAAELYGAKVILRGIADEANNITTFTAVRNGRKG